MTETRVCFKCNQEGHISINCPLNQRRSNWNNNNNNNNSSQTRKNQNQKRSEASINFKPSSSGTQINSNNSNSNDKNCFCSTTPMSSSSSSPVAVECISAHPVSRVSFWDSHAHIEWTLARTHTRSFSDLRTRYFGPYASSLGGVISVFCDPASHSESLGAWSSILSSGDQPIWGAFGVHPHNAKSFFNPGVEDRLLHCLAHERSVAVGECGLDFFYNNSEPDVQRRAFQRQIELATTVVHLPLVVHARDADADVLETMRANVPRHWHVHLHCFTNSSAEFAAKMIDMFPNLVVGVTGVVTFKSAEKEVVDLLVRDVIPLNRLVLETDSPFMIPRMNLQKNQRQQQQQQQQQYPMDLNRIDREGAGEGGSSSKGSKAFSHPGHIPLIAQRVAELKGVSVDEVIRITAENTKRVYKIDEKVTKIKKSLS